MVLPKGNGIIIRDSIHKTIRIPSSIRQLIDSSEMQRLREIKQLGFANLLYPGANGKRFEHSLGVYYLAIQMKKRLKYFIENPPKKADFMALDEEDFALLEISSLLHDIGHSPFSHAIDELPWYDHEKNSETIILNSELSDIIQGVFSLNPKDVIEIINPTKKSSKKNKLLTDILSGPLGLDMLDYLQRDALYAGVPYGIIDVDRLFETIELHPEGKECIIVNDKGILPVESIFFSRFAMFQSVYLHHVIRIAHKMLQVAVDISLEKNGGWLNPNELHTFTDNELISALKSKSPPQAQYLIKAIKNRELYKRFAELGWADLEKQGWEKNTIQEFILDKSKETVSIENPELLGIRNEMKKILGKKSFSDIHIMLDISPLVSKTISQLDVRIRNMKDIKIANFSDQSISAIGNYVDRAYQLLWRMRLIGNPTIIDSNKKKIIQSWNDKYNKMIFQG
ncbi:MAG: HD domain-containing protein [Candidatus Ranarchaeia archaeon]